MAVSETRPRGQPSGHFRSHGPWGAWRQQQAARATLEHALESPTLDCRLVFIESQLAPLFASLGQLLGGKAGAAAAARAAAATLGDITIPGYPTAAPQPAPGALIGAEWAAVESPVVRQLRAVVGLDGCTGLNRALAHGCLFGCWLEVRALAAEANCPEDSLAPRAAWQLSTEVYSHIVADMGWADLAAHALRWHLPRGTPNRVQQQCRLARTLVATCPDLGAGLLEAYLLPVSEGCGQRGPSVTVHEPVQGRSAPACPPPLVHALLEALHAQRTRVTSPSSQKACLAAVAGYLTCLLPATAPPFSSLPTGRQQSAVSAVDSAVLVKSDCMGTLLLGLEAMQDLLMLWASPANVSDSSLSAALASLAHALDVQVAQHIAAIASGGSGGGTVNDSSTDLFQACCHLKARLAMCGLGFSNVPSGSLDPGGVGGSDQDSKPMVPPPMLASPLPFPIFRGGATDAVSAALTPVRICSTDLSAESSSSCSSSSSAERLAATVLLRALDSSGTESAPNHALPDELSSKDVLGRVSSALEHTDGDVSADAAWEQLVTLSAPGWQSPARIAAVCLQLLREVLQQGRETWSVHSGDWQLLCSFCATATVGVTAGAQHVALLELTLEAGALQELRTALAADAQLQAAAAQHLIVVSNHMIEESKAAVHVYEEQSEGVVALAAQLLPTAALAPEATLRRLLLDGIQHSGQAALVVQLMSHLAPLARYQAAGAAHAALPTCAAELLLHTAGLLATDEANAGFKGLLGLLLAPPSPTGAVVQPLLTPAEALQQLVLPGLQRATARYGPTAHPPPLVAPAAASATEIARRGTTSVHAAPSIQRPSEELQLVLELGIACLVGRRVVVGLTAGLPGGTSPAGTPQLEEVGGQMLRQGIVPELLLQLCSLLDARPVCGGDLEGLGHRPARGLGAVAADRGLIRVPMAAVAPALRLAELCCAAVAAHCDRVADILDWSAGPQEPDLEHGSRDYGGHRRGNRRGHHAERARLESVFQTLASAVGTISWRSRLVLAPLVAAEAALAAHAPPSSTSTQWAACNSAGSTPLASALLASSLMCGRIFSLASLEGQQCSAGDVRGAVMDALTLCMAGESVAAAFAAGCCSGSAAESKLQVVHVGPCAVLCRQAALLAAALVALPPQLARQALLAACVALLPCSTAAEYARVTAVALPAWLESMAAPPLATHRPLAAAAGGGAGQDTAATERRAAAEASVLQLASRAAFLLVQQPDAAEDGDLPAAVDQMLHHIGRHCNRLVGAAAASRASTARRCLQEAVHLVAALQGSPVWAPGAALSRRCSPAAQVLLLHLIKVVGDCAARGDRETLEWLRRHVARVQEPLLDLLGLALDRLSDE